MAVLFQVWLVMFKIGLWLLVALLPGWFAHAAPRAAVCVIKSQDQLLLVQDRVSSRYSLSGGYIDEGETPQQAALRELFEETGLRGEIAGEIGPWRTAVLFACRTSEPIVAQQGSGFVSILRAPNLGGEILNARLIAPALLAPEQLRFPEQLAWLQSRLDQLPDSPVSWQADFVAGGSELHQREIPLMVRLQQWLGPDVAWLKLSNLSGSGGFQLALIPLLLPLLGWPRLRQLLFVMLWLGVVVQVSKEGLGWPRPFHLLPGLAAESAQGFGMPSGHTASALLFWGALLGWCWPARPWRALLLALLLAGLTGLARVWLGVHFISDVAVGLLMGGAVLAARPLWGWAEQHRGWWLLLVASMAASVWANSSMLLGIGMFVLGLLVGERFSLNRGGYPAILTGLVALAGGAVLGGTAWLLPQVLSGSMMILVGQWLLYGGLGVWLSAGLWWMLSLLKRGAGPKGG